MTERTPHLVHRMQGQGETIFAQMSALAAEHGAVNLGQGAPDFSGPEEMLDVARQAIADGKNQYAPGRGIRPLREAVAEHQQRFYGLDVDPLAEVTITAGATEGLAAAIMALCEVGDEVLTFEPYYDAYNADVALAGGRHRAITLRPPDYSYDPEALEAAITPRTRLLLLNTPHNPTGKVFSRAEMEHLAEVCQRHDLIVITDEVYEHLVFDGEHIPMATLDGMAERTVTISSAGKTFSVTGWKVGWVVAPPALTEAVLTVKQWLSYSNGTPFQYAVAHGLNMGDDFFEGYVRDYGRRRRLLVDGLRDAGFELEDPAGTYFATLDGAQLGADDAMDLCQRMPEQAGVAAIPLIPFLDHPDRARTWIRLAFCKDDEQMVEGVKRLAAYRDGQTNEDRP